MSVMPIHSHPVARRTEATTKAPAPIRRIALQAICFVASALVLFVLMSAATPQARVLYPIVFLIGWINPVWALYGLGLYGSLFLFDAGKAPWLVTVDVFALGAIAGEVRRLGIPDRDVFSATPNQRDFDSRYTEQANPPPSDYGLWPAWLVAMALLTLGAGVYGVRLVALREDGLFAQPAWPLLLAQRIAYEYPTTPDWSLRAPLNWLSAMVLAVVAVRRATPLRLARWMKFGGAGLLVACLLGLLEHFGLIPLETLRAQNPDPLQAGRLQGLAGHPGWFAQWAVLMAPGLLLWWVNTGNRLRLGVLAAVGIVALTVLLTGTRAAWLGLSVGSILGSAYLFRRQREARPWIAGAFVIAGLTLLGAFAFSEIVQQRLGTLFRASDRFNYFVSSVIFLREHPLGIGLGTHFLTYSWWFPPFFAWYQLDHAAAHSLYLQTLVEGGPAFALCLLAGVALAAFDLRRAWPHLTPGTRGFLLALWAGLVGLLVVGCFQYLPDLRIVELSLWVGFAFSVGVCRREAPAAFARARPGASAVLVLAAALVALVTGWTHLQRPLAGMYPRHYEVAPGEVGFRFWTGERWRIPIDPHISLVAFNALRRETPGSITISWPDGFTETVFMQAGETRSFARTLPAGPRDAFAARRWLDLRTDSTWVPAETIPGSVDTRHLGVYLTNLRVVYADTPPATRP